MIEITRESDDRLTKKGYLFYMSSGFRGDDITIHLDRYVEAERLTTRQKYKTQKHWNRTMSRDNSFTDEEVKSFLTPEIIKCVKFLIKEKIDDLVIKI